jgi:SAM-dependent methyltransferase
MTAAIWHDLECGAYREDLAFWLRLAERHPGPILDVGAGTGRVALELARAGHDVIALDSDPGLLEVLARRASETGAGGPRLQTVCADARNFELSTSVGLCLVPMQTIQLLGGSDGRAGFLACVRRHLAPGAVVAMAILDRLEPFEVDEGGLAPLPDLVELDGIVYCSQPTAVRRAGHSVVLERRREVVDQAGEHEVSLDRISLDLVSVSTLQREGRRLGLRPVAVERIAATRDHVGSQVVILGA